MIKIKLAQFNSGTSDNYLIEHMHPSTVTASLQQFAAGK
jgi:hypothetical protein